MHQDFDADGSLDDRPRPPLTLVHVGTGRRRFPWPIVIGCFIVFIITSWALWRRVH
jgi:hypothetical protein